MPIARFEFPDGRIGRFEVPDGTSPEQAQSMIASMDLSQFSGAGNQESPSFFEKMADNFEHGIDSAGDFAKGNYSFPSLSASKTKQVTGPRMQELADKLLVGNTDPSLLGVARSAAGNIGNIRPSDFTGAYLEKFQQSPSGKALSTLGGVIPSWNAAGVLLNDAVEWVSEATGVPAENIQLPLMMAAPMGWKSAKNAKLPERSIYNWAKSAPEATPEAAAPAATPKSTLSKPMQRVYSRLESDFPDMVQFTQKMNSYASKGDQALVEAGGAKTQNLAEAANLYPSGLAKGEEFFGAKVDAAPERMKASLNKNVSNSANYLDTLDAIVESGRAQAAPLYEAAYKMNPSINSKIIDQILETPEGKSALGEAVRNMQNEMSLVSTPSAELAAAAKEAGMRINGGVGAGLKLQTLDYVKRAFDNEINKAYRTGDNAQAARIISLKNGLLSEITAADKSGLYAKARGVSGDYLSNKSALEAGVNFFKQDSEQLARDWQKYGPAEKKAYKAGVIKSARDYIDTRTDGHNITTIFRREANRRKLQNILSPREYDSLLKEVDAVNTIYQLRNKVLGNSRTQLRKLAAEEFDDAGREFVNGVATRGLTSTIMGEGIKFIQRKFDGLSDKDAAEVARILYETDPKAKALIVKQLFQEAQRKRAQAEPQPVAQRKLEALFSMEDAVRGVKNGAIVGAAQSQPTKITIQPGANSEGRPYETPPAATPANAGKADLSSSYLDKVGGVESGNKYHAQASTSSAYGKYQLTQGTVKDLLQKYGRDYGINFANWKQPKHQETLAKLLSRDNAEYLTNKLGRSPSKAEMYFAHFLGRFGATKLISAQGSGANAVQLFPKEARANRSIFYDRARPRSVEEVAQVLANKIS